MRNYDNFGSTPDIAEEEAFGKSRGERISRDEFLERRRMSTKETVISEESEMAILRRIDTDQSFVTESGLVLSKGPSHPKTPLAKELKIRLEGAIESRGLNGKVKFYSAVKTYLDHLGVDAFIDIIGVDEDTGEEFIIDTITYDTSVIDKGGAHRADIGFQYNGIDIKNESEKLTTIVDSLVTRSVSLLELRKVLTRQQH